MEFLRDRLRYDISYDRQAPSFTLTSVPEPIL
jgi:hypothetical protein